MKRQKHQQRLKAATKILLMILAVSCSEAFSVQPTQKNICSNKEQHQNYRYHPRVSAVNDDDNNEYRLRNIDENANEQRNDKIRRSFLQAIITTASSLGMPTFANAAQTDVQKGELITIPLQYTGDSYVLYYRIDGDLFRAIVDTGSPFLMVPGSCGEIVKSKWGCYRNEGVPSGLESTYEIFDGIEGEVEWKLANHFSFVNATGSLMGPSESRLTFGVASDRLMAGPGGIFFGLVKDTDSWIRPSFLGQTSVNAFQIDLASNPRTLSLSTTPLIGGDYVKLVSDLRRRYGDPTQHYTARAKSICVNGSFLAKGDGKPIYVIFDTGVTGLAVSRELFDERYTLARSRRERKLWGDVRLSFRSKLGKNVELSAMSPVTTVLSNIPWKNFGGHLVVVGLSFMEGNKLTVDIDQGRLWIEGENYA